ncbi:ZCHC3 protein, partial [Polyodon spathula]|nr:ZCHC3 protein [Polyodon spathula]
MFNETVSEQDVNTWIARYCVVKRSAVKVLDSDQIWNGSWRILVKLYESATGYGYGGFRHIPSDITLGPNRGFVFYQGQPKLCRKCGEMGHLAVVCKKEICGVCKEVGHSSMDCVSERRCNLCGEEGHLFRDCPQSFANRTRAGRVQDMTGVGTKNTVNVDVDAEVERNDQIVVNLNVDLSSDLAVSPFSAESVELEEEAFEGAGVLSCSEVIGGEGEGVSESQEVVPETPMSEEEGGEARGDFVVGGEMGGNEFGEKKGGMSGVKEAGNKPGVSVGEGSKEDKTAKETENVNNNEAVQRGRSATVGERERGNRSESGGRGGSVGRGEAGVSYIRSRQRSASVIEIMDVEKATDKRKKEKWELAQSKKTKKTKNKDESSESEQDEERERGERSSASFLLPGFSPSSEIGSPIFDGGARDFGSESVYENVDDFVEAMSMSKSK